MFGMGIDIVENKRIKLNNDFINMILTDNEIEIYNCKNGKRKLEYICGRFALKEALIKAVSDYDNPHMKEIETYNEPNGKPIIKYKDYTFLCSIAHEINYTIAEVILIKK